MFYSSTLVYKTIYRSCKLTIFTLFHGSHVLGADTFTDLTDEEETGIAVKSRAAVKRQTFHMIGLF